MQRRGGPPPWGQFDRPFPPPPPPPPPPPDYYGNFGPPPSPPWEHRDPYGYHPSTPPPPGPHRGWHDQPLTPPLPRRPPPWQLDEDIPPPPPPRHPPPPSFADGPPRERGGRGANRGRGLPSGRGEAPNRGTSTPHGGNQGRGFTSRGSSNGRGLTSPRGASNASRSAPNDSRGRAAPGASRGRGAPSQNRGVTRGAPGRGAASATSGTGLLRGTSNGRGTATRGGRGSSTQGVISGKGGSTSGGSAKGNVCNNQSTVKTENVLQTTTVATTFPKPANMNDFQSYVLLNKAKKEQKKAENAVVKATIPGEVNFISFKNSLQECCQKQQLPVPAYKTWKNNYGYSARVEVAGNTFKSTGIQGDHKEAQQNAAYNALLSLGLIESSVSFDVKTATVIKRPAIDNSILPDTYGKRVKSEYASPVATSYKSRLNEFCQKFRLSIPSYETVKLETEKGFLTTIVFNKKVYQSNGPQPTKKLSEQNAAQVVLHMLNQCPAPAPSYQDFVEHCKQLTSQSTEESSSTGTTSTSTTSLTTTVAAVQQIPLPTAPAPTAQQNSTPTANTIPTPTVQKTATPSVQHFSSPIVEKISTPVTQPSVTAAAAAKPPVAFTSHKNSLQEYCQKSKIAMPVYFSHRENGVFTCTVHVAGVTYTSNSCNTKKGSEQTAANVALKALGLV